MFESKDPWRLTPVKAGEANTISTEQVPPNTVAACLPIQMYGVLYGDDSGRAHRTIFVKMADTWYEAPNSEAWAGGLRPVLSKFTQQLDKFAAASKEKNVPKSDAVDIMGE